MGVPLSHSRQGQGAEAFRVALCLIRHRAALCRTVSLPDAHQSATAKARLLATNNPHLHHHSPCRHATMLTSLRELAMQTPVSSSLLGRYFSYAIQDSPRSLLALLGPGCRSSQRHLLVISLGIGFRWHPELQRSSLDLQ